MPELNVGNYGPPDEETEGKEAEQAANHDVDEAERLCMILRSHGRRQNEIEFRSLMSGHRGPDSH